MQNYERCSPLSPQRQIGTGTNVDEKVMFFSIGDDAQLYLFEQENGSTNGWSQLNLTDGLGVEVHHFAVAQDKERKPVVAIACSKSDRPNDTLIYHTSDFAPDTQSRWKSEGYPGAIGTVQRFAVGTSSYNNQVWIAYAAVKDENVTTYYVNASAKSWEPATVRLPENTKEVLGLEIGHIVSDEKVKRPGERPFSEATVYVLCRTLEGTSRLITSTAPGGRKNHPIAVEKEAAAIAITPDGQGNTLLFVGGKKLYFYDVKAETGDPNAPTPESVGAVLIGEFHQPVKTLAYDKNIPDMLDIWIHTAEGNLSYVYQTKDGHWSSPIALKKQVAKVTTWKNPKTNAIELFYIDANKQLYRLTQDPNTTLWDQSRINTKNLDKSVEFNSFVTQIRLSGTDLETIKKPLRVFASELATVVINGNTYYIDSHSPAECEVDIQGCLTIINRIDTLSSPVFRVEADFLESPVEVNPIAEVKAKLREAVKKMGDNPSEFVNAKVQGSDGSEQSLLSEKYRTENNVRAAHGALSKLLELDDASSSQSSGGFNNRINVNQLPDDYRWEVDFTGVSPVVKFASDVANDILSVATDVYHFFGNVVEAVKEGDWGRVQRMVVEKVEQGVRIVIHIGEKILHYFVEFLEQVWEKIDWFLKEVLGIDLGKFLKWLGFIFGWKDILRTHKVLVHTVNLNLDKLIDSIDGAEAYIKQLFEVLREKLGIVKQAKLPDELKNKSLGGLQQEHKSPLMSSPDLNWSSYQLQHGGVMEAKSSDTSPFSQLLDGKIPTFPDEKMSILENVLKQIEAEFSNVDSIGQLSIGDFAEKVLHVIEYAVIELVETAVLSLFEAVKIVLEGLKAILNKRWDVPLLTWLYEEVIAPGSQLTLLDVLCLLVAIPTTAIYKATFDKSPWSEGADEQILAAKTYDALQESMGHSPSTSLLQL
ncbi:hypothetical protein JYQ62_32670 [Nostoc sp. UHCC 0702]|nr:hypothetical protein JYQ62_32670 [Nostoc sp. UHCC 0702]